MDEFSDNQLLSGYVKNIKDLIKNNPKKSEIEEVLGNKFIVYKEENGENSDIYSILNDDDTILVSEFRRYDNHVIVEKGPIFKNNKKK